MPYNWKLTLNYLICFWPGEQGGKISIVGVYSGFTNHFNLGALMEKNLTVRGGQTPVQAYWHHLLKCIQVWPSVQRPSMQS